MHGNVRYPNFVIHHAQGFLMVTFAVYQFLLMALFSSFWDVGCRTRNTNSWTSSSLRSRQPIPLRWKSWRRNWCNINRATGVTATSLSACKKRWSISGWSLRKLLVRGKSWKTATLRRKTYWGRYVYLSHLMSCRWSYWWKLALHKSEGERLNF